MGYARSPFRDFESYLRFVVGLDEDDIQLILKQYNANFVTFDLDPGNYTIEDIQKSVYPLGDNEGTLQIEYDALSKKTKPILTRFGSTFGTLKIDDTFLIHYWASHHIGIISLLMHLVLIGRVYILVIK